MVTDSASFEDIVRLMPNMEGFAGQPRDSILCAEGWTAPHWPIASFNPMPASGHHTKLCSHILSFPSVNRWALGRRTQSLQLVLGKISHPGNVELIDCLYQGEELEYSSNFPIRRLGHAKSGQTHRDPDFMLLYGSSFWFSSQFLY